MRALVTTLSTITVMTGSAIDQIGKLGVIAEGAYADPLLVNGDSLKDITMLTKPEDTLALIAKDGTIYKNNIK